jgi:hypothetical protein
MPSSTEHAPLGLRLVKVPDAAPPYDCELHGTACPATREVHRGEFAGLGEAGVVGVVGVAGVAVSSAVAGVLGGAVGEPVAASGVDAAWPRQFAQVIVEVLAGSRSRRQIIPWTADRVQAQIRLLAPILACDQQARVRRVVTSRPTARVVEMTVIVSFGPRSRALAMRLEHNPARPAAPGLAARPARWICTELESG